MAILTVYTELLDNTLSGARIINMGTQRSCACFVLPKDKVAEVGAKHKWPRLAKATDEQRANFYLSYSGIHWPDIDEDLSFEGMFAHAGLIERTAEEDAVYYVQPVPYEVPEDTTGMVAEDISTD